MKTSDPSALLGLSTLSSKEQEGLLIAASDIITQNILTRAIPRLEKKDLAGFEKTLEKGDAAEVFGYLEERVPGFETIVSEEVISFRSTLAGFVS